MQIFEENITNMWLYENIDNIDLIINKALIKAKQAIMRQNREDLKEKVSINASGQEAISADIIAETVFLNTLISLKLNGVLYSEESGVKKFGSVKNNPDTSIILLLDPLDGSQNYLKGLPFGCISVAYGKYIDKPYLSDLNKAAILNLYADEIFFAEIGKGAYFNGKKIYKTVPNQVSFEDNITQISYYAYGSKASQYFFDFQKIYSLRSLGSAAWELALVANDRNDAFADIRGVLRAHDFAAAKIILEEAGGIFEFISINGYHSPNDIPLDDFMAGYSIIASKSTKLMSKIIEDFKDHHLL